ncbi:hypothetical protein A2U01_0088677, partial [Trifolium medium]|nr:hypothetical protein [Trifolium medium]
MLYSSPNLSHGVISHWFHYPEGVGGGGVSTTRGRSHHHPEGLHCDEFGDG